MKLGSSVMWNKLKQSAWLDVLVLTVILGLAYFIHIPNFTYYRDDWYYMFDGHAAGPSVFQEMFRSDRPGRGPFFGAYFALFGIDPLPYAVGAFAWRWLSVLGAYGLFRILWPKNSGNHFSAAALFAVFPGYLWWVAGIEYQPMIASLGLQVFSILFSLKTIQSGTKPARVVFGSLSVLTGWAYLALVDYAIGMEVFRWLCIYLVMNRASTQAALSARIRKTLWSELFNFSIPFGYLIWRLFIFQNERRATDIGLQAGQLLSSPLMTGLAWGMNFFQSAVNVLAGAWFVPFYKNFFELRLKSMGMGFTVGILAAAIALYQTRRHAQETDNQIQENGFSKEAVLIGLSGVAFGVIPVIAANRYIVFEQFSHYALPASLAGSLFIAGLLSYIPHKKVRQTVFVSLIVVAAMTHYAVAAKAITEQKAIQEFWWQVSWRAPGIKQNTTLVVNYPAIEYGEDYETVAGPANFIYYPEKTNQIPVPYQLSSISMTSESIKNVLVGKLGVDKIVRSHSFLLDYGNVLVISQPAANACVHLIDPRWADISVSEREEIMLTASESRVDNVILDPQPQFMPQEIFGAEPEHTWCFYYQKAALARQIGAWDEIRKINEQVNKLGLHPNDQIEWMPFLQAAAVLGDEKQMKQISTRINTEAYYKLQACRVLRAMDGNGYPLSDRIQTYADELFCGTK